MKKVYLQASCSESLADQFSRYASRRSSAQTITEQQWPKKVKRQSTDRCDAEAEGRYCFRFAECIII